MDPVFNIVLVEPQIPQNTGSIGRLSVATNCRLHLVEPLGFDISEKAVRRSGLDYWKFVDLVVHPSYAAFRESVPDSARLWFFTKFATRTLFTAEIKPGDYFIFGKETTGLADEIHTSESNDSFLRLPMLSEKVRSLNLSNSASIAVYEGLRQNPQFADILDPAPKH